VDESREGRGKGMKEIKQRREVKHEIIYSPFKFSGVSLNSQTTKKKRPERVVT